MNAGKTSSKKVMIINPEDNVAVCLCELEPGEELNFIYNNAETRMKIMDPVPLGHKVALKNIKKEMPIVKYGEIIGLATSDISIGQHVHVHNVTDYYGER